MFPGPHDGPGDIESDSASTPPHALVLALEASIRHSSSQQNAERLFLECAERGCMSGLERCIAAGVDANCTDDCGRTAIFMACWDGHLPIVRRLLAAGADAELCDAELTSPFSVACENGQIDVVRYLAKGRWRGLRSSACLCAVDVERPDVDACTPFFRACLGGRLTVAKFLAEELQVRIPTLPPASDVS
jgi:hypothetical protein